MAITGIDTIEGKQIIAAGAVSAKSAEMAYNDENGNPITGYQVAGDYYSASNPSGFITGVDLTPYQLTADMTAYQPVGDYLTTADSAEFYTTANESGFITAVPDTYLQNTDLSTEDGKVTAISGIPLSAGGDVPEGVMVESGLEYNAVNEISGYNGSAIAQYGAEKQWLVHDDTLVHAANSAQYALGVNVSAVGELLGVSGPVLNQETFAGYWNGLPLYQQLVQMTFSSNSTTTGAIPAEIYLSAVDNGRRWIDPSNSFIHYGSVNLSLPISWMLASDRRGSICLNSNALNYRGVDGANTGCTAYVCIKYRKA